MPQPLQTIVSGKELASQASVERDAELADVAEKQEQGLSWAERIDPSAEPEAAAPDSDEAGRLAELKRLHDAGLLSDDVYAAEVGAGGPEPEPEPEPQPQPQPEQPPPLTPDTASRVEAKQAVDRTWSPEQEKALLDIKSQLQAAEDELRAATGPQPDAADSDSELLDAEREQEQAIEDEEQEEQQEEEEEARPQRRRRKKGGNPWVRQDDPATGETFEVNTITKEVRWLGGGSVSPRAEWEEEQGRERRQKRSPRSRGKKKRRRKKAQPYELSDRLVDRQRKPPTPNTLFRRATTDADMQAQAARRRHGRRHDMSTSPRARSASDIGPSGVLSTMNASTSLDVLPVVTGTEKARRGTWSRVTPISESESMVEHYFHQRKLDKLKSGVDRKGRTDSSCPVRPSWHYSRKGNLKKKHNLKLLHQSWEKEKVRPRRFRP